MKTRLILSITIFILSFFDLYGFYDIPKTIDTDTRLIEGVWMAEHGNMTYEMELVRQIIPIKDADGSFLEHADVILGKLTYRKNGVITRQTEIDAYSSIITDMISNSPYHVRLFFYDTERRVAGEIEFNIDPDDTKKATWDFEVKKWFPGFNDVDPDIPLKLTWRKVE